MAQGKSLEIVNVDAGQPGQMDLLRQAYDQIFVPAFKEEERETLEKLTEVLEGRCPGSRAVINVLGTDLQSPHACVVKGLAVAFYYEKSNTGLLAYNAIDPVHREKGLGKLMVNSRIESLQKMARDNGKTLSGVFVEIQDPYKVPPGEALFAPVKRQKIFEHWGARVIPVDYVSPPINDSDYYEDDLLLLSYPVNGRHPGPKETEAYLRDLYHDGRNGAVAENDYHFVNMQKQLAGWTPPPVNDNNKKPGYAKSLPPCKLVL